MYDTPFALLLHDYNGGGVSDGTKDSTGIFHVWATKSASGYIYEYHLLFHAKFGGGQFSKFSGSKSKEKKNQVIFL